MSFGQPVAGTHYCSVCGYTYAPCQHAKRTASSDLAAENKALRSTLAELRDAATPFYNFVGERPDHEFKRLEAAFAAAASLLDDSKGEA